MRDLNKYRGIIPAFYCCYDDKGNISRERVSALASFYLEKGVKGLYVEGSSGECIYHTIDERKAVLEAVLDAVKGKLTVIAHVAAPSTKDSIELARHAENAGADAVAAIPGLYYGLSEAMVEQYWTDIANSTNLDMFIYNFPQSTNFYLKKNLLLKMKKLPNLAGIKNSSDSIKDIQIFKAAGGNDFIVFNGMDGLFIAGRVMGADGGIGGTYGPMPELYLVLDKMIREGKMEEARLLQNNINHIIETLHSFPNLYCAAKAVLELRGLKTGGVRLPFLPLPSADIPRIQELHSKIMNLIDVHSN